MISDTNNDPMPIYSYEFQPDSMSVQDALMVLAIFLAGGAVQESPLMRKHIIALARSNSLFLMEDYETTEGRFNRFANWLSMPTMQELVSQALDTLDGAYRKKALEWTAANAIAQRLTDERKAKIFHIGETLGFSASEVTTALDNEKKKIVPDV